MSPSPKLCLGAALGLVLGLLTVMLLWQLGVTPPDRLPLFGILALTMFGGAWALTQRIALARRQFMWVSGICVALGVVSLTGIPEFVRGGYLSDGCFLEAQSSLDTATPATTSSRNPFDVTRDDAVSWVAESDGVLTNWDSALGMRVGGFRIKLWQGSHDNSGESQSWADIERTNEYVEQIQEATGIRLSGVYNVYGYIDADEGSCEMSSYVRVQPDHPFDGPVLIVLWLLNLATVAALILLALRVRRSLGSVGP